MSPTQAVQFDPHRLPPPAGVVSPELDRFDVFAQVCQALQEQRAELRLQLIVILLHLPAMVPLVSPKCVATCEPRREYP